MAISALVYLAFRSVAAFFLSLIAGVLIDIDHILDYYIQKRVTLKIKDIYVWCSERKSNFIAIVLHSVELIFLFWVIIDVFRLGLAWIAVAIGLTQHLVLDIIFNNNILYGYSYFFSYRLIKGFRRERLVR